MSSPGRWRQRLSRGLAGLRRGGQEVRWAEVAPVVLLLGTVTAFGLFWVLGGAPDRVTSGQAPATGISGPESPPGDAASATARQRAAPAAPRPSASPSPRVLQSVDPSAIPSIPECLVPRRFSVLTFNIHGGRTDHGVDLAAVAAEIRAAHADIVLLQEVDQDLARTGFRDEPSVLAARLGMNVYYRAPARSNAILTRFPVTRWSSTRLPLWAGREERRLVQATVLVGGQPVHVFTTHLDQSYAGLRVEQIRAAQRLMAPYADEAVVLGGDLNSPASGAVLHILGGQLRDSWTEVGRGPGNTVPAGHPRIRIDYLLHNSWLSAEAAQVLPSRASDHRSVRVVFDLWGRAGCGS